MKLKVLRESAGLTQEDVGQALGLTRTAIAMWESGVSFPRAEMLLKLAELFHCTVDELLRKDEGEGG